MTGKTLTRYLGPSIGVLLFVAALWSLSRELQHYHFVDLRSQLRAIPRRDMVYALLATFGAYLTLTCYDLLAFEYIRHPLRRPKVILASFIGYAFSQSLGFPLLTGGAIRYRLYSSWGLSAPRVANVIAFCSTTFLLGVLTTGGFVFATQPIQIPALMRLPLPMLRAGGVLALLLVAGYVAWCALVQRPIRIREWEFPVPPLRIALAQIFVGCVDWALAALVLYVLLPPDASVTYFSFLGIYLLAALSGVLSHVPGGLGVFEGFLVFLLPDTMEGGRVLGALVAYRIIYYLIPLTLAAALLGVFEAMRRREGLRKFSMASSRWIGAIAPTALAVTAFFGGTVMLFSGATPALRERLFPLSRLLPLQLIEFSHFFASIVGVGLLLLAQGLQRRLDAAWLLAVVLLAAGIPFSLMKGFDYEEAFVLLLMLGALLPARQYFYRKASLLSESFTPGWIAAIGVVIAGSVALGFFSYKHVGYDEDLWLTFATGREGNAARFLRASAGVLALSMAIAFRRLMRPSAAEPALPTREELDRANEVLANEPDTTPQLALLGDKSLLFSDDGRAFLMYGIEGRSWVALGDPVGESAEHSELVWRFRELADRHGGWPVFYQVSREDLPLYLDLGLTLLKLGEEARVPLPEFNLDGQSRKSLRRVRNGVIRDGGSFEMVPQCEVAALMPQLRRISDAWLSEKSTREKGFSLGFFNEDYLARFPMALVRRDGEIVAFANVMTSAGKEELSVDLMRFMEHAPENVMEYLFIELMLWGKAEGYNRFNLGMAPLAGLQNRQLAPLWSKLGALVYRHGEHFYHFKGLRLYKSKFDPVWEPKYLACPGGLALPRILTNIAALISGGLRGVIAR
jgi:phosphatidylglycerol lysyltransferase